MVTNLVLGNGSCLRWQILAQQRCWQRLGNKVRKHRLLRRLHRWVCPVVANAVAQAVIAIKKLLMALALIMRTPIVGLLMHHLFNGVT
ncbi:hypothetical protein [Vibrio vulnificus YJ016]|uniref:Uncharacterized protein n=1 Tax=Vibrio vulnificus (strain YJ016) TaxID=196600 RepID=Q7MC70_VIBVY|nr:hypothetical protein [Vibrio vulnificus YJ016]